MRVKGLNHITLGVTSIGRAISFYRDALGFELRASWSSGAYLEAGSLWLCLIEQSEPLADRSNDYSHIALSVDKTAFETMAEEIQGVAQLWKTNLSEGKSLYFLDPDGHRLEIHVGDLSTRIAHYLNTEHPDITIHGSRDNQSAKS